MIEAALRNEGVAQTGFPASGQDGGAQPAGARPVAVRGVEEQYLAGLPEATSCGI
jgi:hypothetical protein